MHNFDKAKILKDRRINIAIEWGGTDMFAHVSNMSVEGMVEFLRIMQMDDEKMIDGLLTDLIQQEYERE